MRFLVSAYHRRLWLNVLPTALELQRRGHEVVAAYLYWPAVDNLGYEEDLRREGLRVVAGQWRNDPSEDRMFFARLLWADRFSGVLLGDDGQAPAWYVHSISRVTMDPPPTVFVMQHGYCQSWVRLLQDLRGDFFLCWGPYSREHTAGDSRFLVTGNPRFDSLRPEDAEDGGYTLVVAWPNEINAEWLARWAAWDGQVIVKAHPDDYRDYSTLDRPGLRILTGRQDTTELIRKARRVVTGPSTCWIEAALYGKEIVPTALWGARERPPPELLERTLLRGACASRIADLMEQSARTGGGGR